MRTLLNDPPAIVRTWLDERQARGQDRYDEMWEGVYHVAPAAHPSHGILDDQLGRVLGPYADAAGLVGSGPLNVGTAENYRVPDRAYLRAVPRTTFVPSVAIAVEIVSPHDESWAKLDFYFGHGVEELLMVDPRTRDVRWLVRGGDGFEVAAGSTMLGLDASDLAAALNWPPVD